MVPTTAAIRITEERTFSAQLGGRTITGLAVASAWEGFTKYTNADGHLIVLDAEQRVVTASPDLIAQLGIGGECQVEGMLFGAPLAGGYFTGVITVDGKRYALITAGAEGELSAAAWHPSASRIEGAVSRRDGKENTLDMLAAGCPLAKQAAALNIGGHTDWYIPSRDEQELQYRAFKPTDRRNFADGEDGVNPNSAPAGTAYTKEFPVQTTVENFRAGGADALAATWYWSSTQHASDPSDAWLQYFFGGSQFYGHKSLEGRARAVRRLPI